MAAIPDWRRRGRFRRTDSLHSSFDLNFEGRNWRPALAPELRIPSSAAALLQRRDLRHALGVAVAAGSGGEEGAHGVEQLRLGEHLGAEADHIGVVVFARVGGALRVPAGRGADAGELVGGDGAADAGAVEGDAEVGRPLATASPTAAA